MLAVSWMWVSRATARLGNRVNTINFASPAVDRATSLTSTYNPTKRPTQRFLSDTQHGQLQRPQPRQHPAHLLLAAPIPSDAGGGSQATLFAPSVYEQTSPRRHKDQVAPSVAVKQQQPSSPRRAQIPPTVAVKQQQPHSPRRAQVPSSAAVKPPPPTPTSPRRPPQTPNPAIPTPRTLKQNPPTPAPTAPPAPGPTPLPLRAQITANFTSHCLICTNGISAAAVPDPAPCLRCRAAHAFAHRTHHNTHFLTSHLLPISRHLSFDEMVGAVNMAIAGRLDRERAGNGGGGKTYPTLDDFDFVRGVAMVRGRVVREREGLGVDWFGILRDRGSSGGGRDAGERGGDGGNGRENKGENGRENMKENGGNARGASGSGETGAGEVRRGYW